MVKAYTITKTGGQVSSESTVIIPSDPPKDGQPENDSVKDAAPYVTKAARKYFDNYLLNTGEDSFSLQELEITPDAAEAGAIVCVFDAAEVSLKLVKPAGLADRCPLLRFLNSMIWKDLTDIWDLDTDIGRKIKLFSGETCLPLTQFKTDLQRLVNDDVTQRLEDVRRTAFWERIVVSKASSKSTEQNYVYKSSGSNTIPRTSRPSHSRSRITSDSFLFVPRSMPDANLDFTDQYKVNAGHNDSETSDSAEEGNHGS